MVFAYLSFVSSKKIILRPLFWPQIYNSTEMVDLKK